MSDWRNIWTHGLPNEGRSPKSGHWIAAEGMQFSWRWNGGTIPLNLGVIWEMSDKLSKLPTNNAGGCCAKRYVW